MFGKRGLKVVVRAIFLPDANDQVLITAAFSQNAMRVISAHSQDQKENGQPKNMQLILCWDAGSLASWLKPSRGNQGALSGRYLSLDRKPTQYLLMRDVPGTNWGVQSR